MCRGFLKMEMMLLERIWTPSLKNLQNILMRMKKHEHFSSCKLKKNKKKHQKNIFAKFCFSSVCDGGFLRMLKFRTSTTVRGGWWTPHSGPSFTDTKRLFVFNSVQLLYTIYDIKNYILKFDVDSFCLLRWIATRGIL